MSDWLDLAECLDEDPELFFPIGKTGPAVLQIAEAKAVCDRCYVRETCLRVALDTGQEHGIWGGLDDDERRSLKRRERRERRTPRSKFAAPMHDPAVARELLNAARDAGRTWAQISEAVGGVNEAHLSDIARGRIEGLREATHERIVAAFAGQEVRS